MSVTEHLLVFTPTVLSLGLADLLTSVHRLVQIGYAKPTARTADDRLVALKNKYDPANFVCLNQNIAPAGAAAV